MKLLNFILIGSSTVLALGAGSCDKKSSSSAIVSSPVMVDQHQEAMREFHRVSKEMALKNFLVSCSGEVNAKVAFIDYKQKISSNKVKNGEELFFETYTTSALVSKAEQRYENRESDVYGYLTVKDEVRNDGDAEVGYTGSANWDGSFKKVDQSGYLQEFGHSLFAITNYEISEENEDQAILAAEKLADGNDGEHSYKYTVSVESGKSTVDATAGYAVEMAHMSGMGTPKFKQASFIMTLNATGGLKEIRFEEQYSLKIMGISTSCSSWMVSKFSAFDEVEDLPAKVKDNYTKALKKLAY